MNRMLRSRRLVALAVGVLLLGVLALLAGCGSSQPSSILVYAFLSSFNGRGAQPDSLNSPLAILPLGNGVLIREVWVAENAAGRISRFGFDGSYIGFFIVPGPQGGASALAAGGDSVVYILESAGRRVCSVDTLGNLRGTFSTDSSFTPYGIAVGGGHVFVSEQSGNRGRVEVFGLDGVLQGILGVGHPDSLVRPVGLALRDSSLWVCDAGDNKVKLYRPDGRYVGAIGGLGAGNGSLNNPQNIALTDEGHLLVTDQNNLRIEEFAPGGTYVTQFGGAQLGNSSLLRLSALAVSGSSVLGEFIYFSDLNASRIYIVVRRYVYAAQKTHLLAPAI